MYIIYSSTPLSKLKSKHANRDIFSAKKAVLIREGHSLLCTRSTSCVLSRGVISKEC